MKYTNGLHSKKERGLTLIEVLIASAIFGAFLTAFYLCLEVGLKSYSKGEEKFFSSSNACAGMELMQREIRQCDKIYLPADSGDLDSGYPPDSNPFKPFIFKFKNSVTLEEKVIGYKITPEYKLQRILYQPGFDPADSATWLSPEVKTLAESVQNLKFKYDSNDTRTPKKLLKIYLTSCSDGADFPLETEVNLR